MRWQVEAELPALYATIALLVIGMQSEIFVPYFLQVLHGRSALVSGYLAALMAMGWTLGSLVSADRTGEGASRAVASGPVCVFAGLAILTALLPTPGSEIWRLLAVSGGLFLVGLGIGVAWPHLVTGVFREVDTAEQGLAAGSVTTVQLFATALGAAVAGMVANLGGVREVESMVGASGAAFWLFAVFLVAPLLAVCATRRLKAGRIACC